MFLVIASLFPALPIHGLYKALTGEEMNGPC